MMKVSVIIPVYNCEKFIDDCLECLSGQTMKEFEVIFVDDCSSDNTPMRLQDAVTGNDTYHYYRNEQKRGAAYSRNRGIELSQAPYILCLDADDRYEYDLLEQVTRAAYENDADMVMLERNDFYGTDLSTIERTRCLLEDEKKLYQKVVFSVKEQPVDFLLRCKNGTCDRMIRREVLEQYQIRFQDLQNSNDVFYVLFATFCAKKIVHTATYDDLYHRRVHAEPGRISNYRDPMCAFEALLAVRNSLLKYQLWNEYCIPFWIFALDSLEKQLFVCRDEERKKEVYEYLQREGLSQLGIRMDEQFTDLPEEFQMQYKKILECPFEENCFQKSMTMEALCHFYSWKLTRLAQTMKNKKLAFWGAGRVTNVFIDAYREHEGEICYIIDNDLKKQGNKIADCTVVAWKDKSAEIDAVIISNRNYYNAIREQILQEKPEVDIFSLEEIIYS